MNNVIRNICKCLVVVSLLGTLEGNKINAEENGSRKIIVFDESFQEKDNLIKRWL